MPDYVDMVLLFEQDGLKYAIDQRSYCQTHQGGRYIVWLGDRQLGVFEHEPYNPKTADDRLHEALIGAAEAVILVAATPADYIASWLMTVKHPTWRDDAIAYASRAHTASPGLDLWKHLHSLAGIIHYARGGHATTSEDCRRLVAELSDKQLIAVDWLAVAEAIHASAPTCSTQVAP